jgi:hypothetical protein
MYAGMPGIHGSGTGYPAAMATQKQRQAARKNVKKAQSGARQKRTISKLSKRTRRDLGREGAKAAARKRGASKGTGSGAGAMTVTELRREAAKLGIEGRSKMGKAQLIRSVGQKRRSR